MLNHPTFMKLLFTGLLISFLALSAATQASPTINPSVDSTTTPNVSVLYCLDGQDRSTLGQAKQCRYGAYADVSLPARYAAIRWVKVQAEISDTEQTLTIGAFPHLLRNVEIFEGQTNERLAGPVGTAYPYSAEHGLLAGYSFSIKPGSPGNHDYFVRMVTYGVPYSFVEASLTPATAKEIHQQVGLGIHLGILGLLTLISLGMYAATRAPIMGVFALNILNLLMSILLGSGFLYENLWPNWPKFNELLFQSMFYVKPALWVWLAQTFLAPYQTPAWYRHSCHAVYVLVAFMLLTSWLGFGYISSGLMLVFGATVIPIVQLVAIQKTRDIRNFYKRILMLGYGLGIIAIWMALLVTIYPTDNPRLPIQLTRVIDYANPIVLLGLVMFHYRETTSQLATAKEDNLAMQLSLDFEQKSRSERKLMIDMLTHELKNPLATINMATGSLTKSINNNDEAVKRRLKNIEQSVRSMDAVIERCSLMNQIDQRALKYQFSTIDLREVLTKTISRLGDDSRVILTLNGSDKFGTDPDFFQMIVSNLIDNALKYSPTGTKVTVSIDRKVIGTARHLVMAVTSEIGSKGVPDKTKVFARFYRHPLAQDTSGSGVGLYLVEALTKLMHGNIDYQPSTHHVTFQVTLPEVLDDA